MYLLKALTLILIVLLTTYLGICYYLADSISAPSRRPLKDYHYSWLHTPQEHGITLQSFTASDGTPVLVVEPSGTPGKRGETLRAQLTSPPPYGQIEQNLILIHGRKGRKEDLLPAAERFCAAGFRCILMDMPRHGDHPAQKNYFATTEYEAQLIPKAFQEIKGHFQWPDIPNNLWGISMGGAYVNKTLTVSPHLWKKAVIVCSFDDLMKTIQTEANKAGPLSQLVKQTVKSLCIYDLEQCKPVDWASHIPHPVLVAHGDADKRLTIQQGKALFHAYPSPAKAFITVPGADHDNILVTSYPLYAEMVTFLQK